MTRIEKFADDVSLIISVERHPHDIAWSASFRAEGGWEGVSLWIKETGQPPCSMGSTAAPALEDLVSECRGKSLIIGGLPSIAIPEDLST